MPVNKVTYADYVSGTGPSYALWHTCPWLDMLADPNIGYCFFDDFLTLQQYEDVGASLGVTEQIGPYITDQDTGVTIGPLETADEVGGVLEICNNDADNDFGHIYLGGSANALPFYILNTGFKPFWFEARFKKAAIGNDGLAFFFGLGETGLITTDGGALTDNTGVVKDENYIGFTCVNADGDALVPQYRADGQTASSETGLALVADTYTKAGMYGDGRNIHIYTDGVLRYTWPYSEVNAATFPYNTYMTMMLLTKTGATAEIAFQMDWWRVAQLR